MTILSLYNVSNLLLPLNFFVNTVKVISKKWLWLYEQEQNSLQFLENEDLLFGFGMMIIQRDAIHTSTS